MSNSVPDRDRRRQRQQVLSDVSTAQAVAGRGRREASSLERVGKAVRGKLRTRAHKDVWDACIATAPGKETLRLCQAILGVQAYEVTRLLRDYAVALDKGDSDKADGIAALLGEVRRNGRQLKSLTDGLVKAAKVASEIDIDSLPDRIEFVGASTLRSQLTGDAEPSPLH